MSILRKDLPFENSQYTTGIREPIPGPYQPKPTPAPSLGQAPTSLPPAIPTYKPPVSGGFTPPDDPIPNPDPYPLPTPIPDPPPPPPEWQEDYTMPAWMRGGANTYLKNPVMSEESGVDIKQDWYRDPQWGGHIAWNPHWGFQDRTDVQKMYSDYGEPMPWDAFTGLGLTQNQGPNWQQFFPDREPIYGNTGASPTPTTPSPTPSPSTTPGTGTGGGAGKGGMDMNNIDPNLLSSGQQPFEGVTTEMLQNFGYTGNVPLNPYEQLGMNQAEAMARNPAALETMAPGQNLFNQILGGQFGPQGDAYQSDVYEATKAGAMQNLGDLQKGLSEDFAHRGGYFGGKHSIAQADLANKFGTGLNQTLADLNYNAWNQDMTNRMGSAQGLAGMAGQQQDIFQQNLGNVQQAGATVTGREALNRAEWQRANEGVYNDWLRARNENVMPYQIALSLLGMQPFQPIVQQPQQSPWSGLLGGVGQGFGMLGVSKLGDALKKKPPVYTNPQWA